MAYEDDHDVAFIALDTERLGETANDGTFTDVGDNETRYKVDVHKIDYDSSDDDADDNDENNDVNDNDIDKGYRDTSMMSAIMQEFLLA